MGLYQSFKRPIPLGRYATVFQAEVFALNKYIQENL